MVPASGQPCSSLGPTNSSVPINSATPIGMPMRPSHPGEDRRREDRCCDQERPDAGQQVSEVLPDPDAEQTMERRERDLDRATRRRGVRAIGGHVATGQLRDGERPAHEPERLHQRRGRAHDDGGRGERRRSAQRHGQQRNEGEHREGAQQQRLPAQDQPGPAGGEPSQDLVGLLAQDVRVVEGPSELEEGEVERDRDRDQQCSGHDVHGVGVCAPIHPAATRADWRRPRPRSAR